MKVRSLTPLVAAILPMAYMPAAQTLATPASTSASSHSTAESNIVRQDPQLVTGELTNGLSYIIRPNQEPKGRLYLKLRVQTGSLNEHKNNLGISHFIEHMVFNGSKNFKDGDIMQVMQRHGLGLGGDANAYTSFDETVYMINLPNLKDDTVKLAFTILRDFADGAFLTEKEIDKERGVIASEYKARDSANMRLMEESFRFLLDGSIIADRMPIGSLDFIKTGPRSLFLDYYKTYYQPQNMQLVLVGDITPEQGKKWAEQYFGSMVRSANMPQANWGKVIPASGVSARWISHQDATGQIITIASPKPYDKKADTVQERIKGITEKAAMSMLSRRFDKLSKQSDCPFISATMGKDTLFQLAEVVELNAATNPGSWQQTLTVLEQELRRAQQFGFTQAEVDDVVKNMQTNAQVAIQSWKTAKSPTISQSIIGAIGNAKVFTAPQEDMRILQEALKQGAVTPQACQKALQQMIDLKNLKIIVTSKQANPQGNEQILATWNQSAQQQVLAQQEEARKPFAYETIGAAGKVVSNQFDQASNTHRIVLSNGIRVNLKKTPYDQDIIHIQADVAGGAITMPAGKEGLNVLAPHVMNAGGLAAHSQDDLTQIMAGHSVGHTFMIAPEHFLLTGSTTPKDLELELKYLAATLMHSGYRPEAESMLRRALPLIYDSMKKEPQGILMLEGLKFLRQGDPRFYFPSKEAVEQVTTNDVKQWIDPALKNNYLEISLVGDFDPAAVIPVLEKTIGALPKRAAKPPVIDRQQLKFSIAPGGSSAVIPYSSSIDRTLVCVVWPTTDGLDAQKARQLALVKDILRERLFQGIREKMGEAYSPQVQNDESLTYPGMGHLMALIPGTQSNKDKVLQAVKDIVSDLAKGQITQDEFSRALKPLLNKQERFLRDNKYWLSSISQSQSRPEFVTRALEAIKGYQSISVDQINQLVKQIFAPGKEISIAIVPQMTAVPRDGKEASTSQAQPIQPIQAPPQSVPAIKPQTLQSPYVVLVSQETAKMPEWMTVAQTLQRKYKSAKIVTYQGRPDAELPTLKKISPRYMAIVAPPEQIDRELVNQLHRLTRKLDTDPYGDCIWGIVTGFTPQDAMRIAQEQDPLTITRAMGTTNIDANRFSDSMCITDWHPFEVVEQHGYKKAEPKPLPQSDKGVVPKFVEFWTQSHPELVVTSSHATQYNLEMPFGKGLIVSYDNQFHILTIPQKNEYASFLKGVLFDGKEEELAAYLQKNNPPVLPHDATPKVWIAAGNCLFGDAKKTKNSMAVTALSGYGCNQLVGYTVPTWYGKGGWGALSLFMGNHNMSSFAEAWYLNNQFLLEETMRLFPVLINVEFNASSISAIKNEDPNFLPNIQKANCGIGKDQMGLVHDRDVVAFYGDPAWTARLDESHARSPWSLQWNDSAHPEKGLTITANMDHSGRFAVWFPKKIKSNKAVLTIGDQETPVSKIGVQTDDFIIIPELKLGSRQKATITF